jgi:hypothetical protein
VFSLAWIVLPGTGRTGCSLFDAVSGALPIQSFPAGQPGRKEFCLIKIIGLN